MMVNLVPRVCNSKVHLKIDIKSVYDWVTSCMHDFIKNFSSLSAMDLLIVDAFDSTI